MSWTLLRGTLHQRRASMFWFSLGLIVYAWFMTWFYQHMDAGQFAQLLQMWPPELVAMFGGTEVSLVTLGGYFQVEYLGLMWLVIVSTAVVLFAVRAFAGEIAAGTMELLLSQPISRVRVAVTRVAVLIGYVLLLAAASFGPIQIFGPTYGIHLGAGVFWTLLAFGVLYMLAVGGLAMLFSSIFRDGAGPSVITAGILLLFWIADLVSSVSKVARVLRPVNLISYWQPGKIINGDTVAAEAWWIYGAVGVASLVAAVLVFSRRDVA
ncbi:MAG: ABC transporter permease subunit [Actinobacteria bacterium]|nr:ABC transporter permease subunit [Actinomycetota bacterium]